MILKKNIIEGSYTIELDKKSDKRGFFARAYCKDILKEKQIVKKIHYACIVKIFYVLLIIH